MQPLSRQNCTRKIDPPKNSKTVTVVPATPIWKSGVESWELPSGQVEYEDFRVRR